MNTMFKPSDQTWAWFFVSTGAGLVLFFKHFGIDVSVIFWPPCVMAS